MDDKMFVDAGQISLGAEVFENPSINMLVIDESNIHEHISKQAAAIAYYGALCRCAIRDYEDKKRAWGRRQKEMYLIVSNQTDSKKMTVKDIDAKVFDEFKTEIDKWEEQLYVLKKKMDDIQSFLDGWNQKSFSLNNYVAIQKSERGIADSYSDDSDVPEDLLPARGYRPKANVDKSLSAVERMRKVIRKDQ